MKRSKSSGHFLRSIEYQLTDEDVRVLSRSFRGRSEERIKYDRIAKEGRYIVQRSAIALYGSILFGLVAILTLLSYLFDGSAESTAWLFYSVLACAALIYYRMTKIEGIKYVSDFGNLFVEGRRKDVLEFQKEIEREKIGYIERSIRSRSQVLQNSEVERYLLSLKEGGVIGELDFGSMFSRLRAERDPGGEQSSRYDLN
jgi:hypothetical protein